MNTLQLHSIETFGTHDGPGIRLVLFLQGCNMRCLYCHNPDTQELNSPDSKTISCSEVVELLRKQESYFSQQGGLTISGGEPTVQAPAVLELLEAVKAAGFHTVLDTNGGIVSPTVKKIYELTDLLLLDVKHINNQWHQKITGVSNDNVLANAAWRESSGQPMWLRYVLVPGYSDQPQYLEEWAKHFASYQTVEKVEILPYHTLGVYKYQQLGRPYALSSVDPPQAATVKQAQEIFSRYFARVEV